MALRANTVLMKVRTANPDCDCRCSSIFEVPLNQHSGCSRAQNQVEMTLEVSRARLL